MPRELGEETGWIDQLKLDKAKCSVFDYGLVVYCMAR